MSASPYAVRSWELSDRETAPRGRALVLPGGNYTVDHPLLFWTCQVLAAGGWQVNTVRWTVPEVTSWADRIAFVEAGADAALAAAPAAETTLVVGKSLGSLAAGWALANDFPAIWLTPLLTRAEVVEPLLSYRRSGLLVGGTADRLWDGDAARRTALEVLEIEGGDHALHIGDDWRASLDAHGRAMAAVESFATGLT